MEKEEGCPGEPLRLALLLPAFNESMTISKVIADGRAALPGARIVVFDNNSADGTADLARTAGVEVRAEPRQGKGFIVRRMFADVEADVYVLVDADDTYDLSRAGALVRLLLDRRLDMVVGARDPDGKAYRPGHSWGNRAFNRVVERLFGRQFRDIFSGYRVLSRRFVKSFPADATGFDIEAEMTVHALEMKLPVAEVPTRFRERPPGSTSKLSTIQDGLVITGRILLLFKDVKPITFFGLIAGVLALTSLGLGIPIVADFIETGQVPRFPTAILATGLAVLSALALMSGIILGTVSRARLQAKTLAYLAQPWMERPPP